jgi:hypothetical protein
MAACLTYYGRESLNIEAAAADSNARLEEQIGSDSLMKFCETGKQVNNISESFRFKNQTPWLSEPPIVP